jgi:hypothetical protein
MEEFFNLPPTEETVVEIEQPSKSKDELMLEAKEIMSSLTTAEKVDCALPMVVGLEEHDHDMDNIHDKAIKTFEDLVSLGGNVPDMHSGKIYEVAGQMLKTALEAKNAKAEKKLRMIELQLKKIKAEQADGDQGNNKGNSGTEFDRNDLLKYIVSANSQRIDK